MVSYLTKRVFQAVLTIYIVISLSFALIRLLPGGPIDYLRAQLLQQNADMTPAEATALVEAYTNIHPDQPLYIQYIDYMTDIAQGDFGQSIWYNVPVTELIADALPWTVFVMSISIILTFFIGISFGAIMAYHEGDDIDVSATVLSIFFNSIPYYIAAVVLLYFLGYQTNIFPTRGRMPEGVTIGMNLPFLLGVLYHATLPIISLVITGIGGWAISMRGNSIRVLGDDYIRVARLRGLPERRIIYRYVGYNAVLPMYTLLTISLGTIFGGSVILEEIFAYKGMGFYIFRSISARDYPLMMGGFIIITIAIVIGVFIADLTYGKLDPRAGQGGENYE